MDDCCSSEKKPETSSLPPLQAGDIESVFKISGADCADEVRAIEKAMAKIGLNAVAINLLAATVTLRHPADFSMTAIAKAIESSGVKIVENMPLSFFQTNKRRILLVGGSGLILGAGLVLEWTSFVPEMVFPFVFGIAAILGGTLIFPKALRSLQQKTLDMNMLMTVAVLGAFAIKEYSEAASVVFLFSLAELLETFSVDRARKAIREVLKLTPQVAWKKSGDAILAVPVLEVALDDILIVRPGESVPLDGVVIEGASSVNQSAVTGESKLVAKTPGDQIFAGTVNDMGTLTFTVTKAFQDTKISRVMKLIEEAQDQKAPSERFVDQFAKIYTPIVFLLGVLVATIPPLLFGQSFDLWFYRALVLLVIACPCALVIATPISVVSGLASLARRGVLVKGGIHLEALGKIRAIAVDKTGTLTEGKFKVQNLRLFATISENEVLQLALSLESLSTHPLASAVKDHAARAQVDAKPVTAFTAVPGRGAEGMIGDHLYFVGNHRYAHELGVCTPELETYLAQLENDALSVVIVGHKPHDGHAGEVLGVLSLGDRIRANARTAVDQLHKAGVEKVIVLSGDNQKTVDAIKLQSGIDEGIGEMLPEDKVERIKALVLEYGEVAMVGDGINDAPALAHATVGIAMGAAGTDAAIETADVALMQDNLMELSKAILQGRRVLSIIRFNIAFAVSTKLIFLVLAVTGHANLWLAVAADMGASIFVTINALRLLSIPKSDLKREPNLVPLAVGTSISLDSNQPHQK